MCADILPLIFVGLSLFKVSFFPEDMIGQDRLSLTALLKNKKIVRSDYYNQAKNGMELFKEVFKIYI
jgi:hypothetical protein